MIESAAAVATGANTKTDVSTRYRTLRISLPPQLPAFGLGRSPRLGLFTRESLQGACHWRGSEMFNILNSRYVLVDNGLRQGRDAGLKRFNVHTWWA